MTLASIIRARLDSDLRCNTSDVTLEQSQERTTVFGRQHMRSYFILTGILFVTACCVCRTSLCDKKHSCKYVGALSTDTRMSGAARVCRCGS